jgi:predicted HTH transcriptional regulator
MVKLSEVELKKLIKGGETNTVELKVAAPRAVEMAERLCGMANAQLRSARMPFVSHGRQVAYS